MLEDPRKNFAISTKRSTHGLDHLGIQVDDEDSLKQIAQRLKSAQEPILEQEQTACCYAKSDKAWVHDPQGIAWESFYTIGSSTSYGEDENLSTLSKSACCAPEPQSETVIGQIKKMGCSE